MADSKNLYFGFYDEIASKYNYSPPQRKLNQNSCRGVYRVHNELLNIIDCIRKESGFNTNAPESRYQKARELFNELEGKLDKTKDPETNKALVDKSIWALFQNLDHMEAINILKRVKL